MKQRTALETIQEFKDTYGQIGYNSDRISEGFEVVNFVATTRRWYDKGKPGEMREGATPAKVHFRGSKLSLLPFPIKLTC